MALGADDPAPIAALACGHAPRGGALIHTAKYRADSHPTQTAEDYDGNTALHQAAARGDVEAGLTRAKNVANIVWQHFLGVGIIDPVDDVERRLGGRPPGALWAIKASGVIPYSGASCGTAARMPGVAPAERR